MRCFACCITCRTYCSDYFIASSPVKNPCFDFVKMCVVMKSPFGTKYDNYISTHFYFSAEKHKTRRGRTNSVPFLSEYVNSFVGHGFSPWVIPKGFFVIVRTGSIFHWHRKFLRNQKPHHHQYQNQEPGCFFHFQDIMFGLC